LRLFAFLGEAVSQRRPDRPGATCHDRPAAPALRRRGGGRVLFRPAIRQQGGRPALIHLPPRGGRPDVPPASTGVIAHQPTLTPSRLPADDQPRRTTGSRVGVSPYS